MLEEVNTRNATKNIMLREEFEEAVHAVRCETGLNGPVTISTEDYKIIEDVYMWYPTMIDDSSDASRAEIATLYVFGGMSVIHDMHRRAIAYRNVCDERDRTTSKCNRLSGVMEYLKNGGHDYEQYLQNDFSK